MTAKRDSKSKPKKERSKAKKETVKDLKPRDGEKVKGGNWDIPAGTASPSA